MLPAPSLSSSSEEGKEFQQPEQSVARHRRKRRCKQTGTDRFLIALQNSSPSGDGYMTMKMGLSQCKLACAVKTNRRLAPHESGDSHGHVKSP